MCMLQAVRKTVETFSKTPSQDLRDKGNLFAAYLRLLIRALCDQLPRTFGRMRWKRYGVNKTSMSNGKINS